MSKLKVLRSLFPCNSVGREIVMRSFVGGWVSEWVRGCVTLYLVDMIAPSVFSKSLFKLYM